VELTSSGPDSSEAQLDKIASVWMAFLESIEPRRIIAWNREADKPKEIC
jgi:hypothetical protein